MAFATQALSNISLPILHPYRDVQPSSPSSPPLPNRRLATKQRFNSDLTQCLCDFVVQLLPTQKELAVREDVRKLLERLIQTIEPESRLLSFGSAANGFSLRNSDMDLCCLIDSKERLAASDLVTMLGDLLERETKFHVKPLPHARIPIVKLTLDPSPGLPLGIACDIGFENRLALENTRLLMCYALVDPTRIRTLVLFLKVWSKRRKINSPYKGTLSSYGYVLLVIYFLVHVKNPPVLPNLQQMPPLRPISKEDTHLNGHNIWFFDDIDLLRQRWRSENTETVAELLIDFFRYYSRDFAYNIGVASIRAGLLQKESKGWQNDLSGSRFNDARERNRLCIEDPFEMDYNVARCVTRDGLYTIRGEFMRAFRILTKRPDRAIVALSELCEERSEELISPPQHHAKPPTLPPQTPYTVGGQNIRPKLEENLSPTHLFDPGRPSAIIQPVALRPPPEHMAPKRGKWTSPPPPEASLADHKLFENQLGIGLQLATSSTEAREKDNASESNSEVLTDEGSDILDDDVKSVQSYTEGSRSIHSGPVRRPSWHTPHETMHPPPAFNIPLVNQPTTSNFTRRRFSRVSDNLHTHQENNNTVRRTSFSQPPRSVKHHSLPPHASLVTSLPPSSSSTSSSPIVNNRFPFPPIDPTNIYYQASPLATALRAVRHVQPPSLANARQLSSSHADLNSASHPYSPVSLTGHLQTQNHSPIGRVMQSPSDMNNPEIDTIKAPVPRDIFPSNLSAAMSGLNFRSTGEPRTFSFGSPDTPTPATFQQNQRQNRKNDLHSPLHSRSNSTTVVAGASLKMGSVENYRGSGNSTAVRPEFDHDEISTSTTTTSLNSGLDPVNANIGAGPSAHSPQIDISETRVLDNLTSGKLGPQDPSRAASGSSNSSPIRASPGGQYSTGLSRSLSPPSPVHPPSPLSQILGKERSDTQGVVRNDMSGEGGEGGGDTQRVRNFNTSREGGEGRGRETPAVPMEAIDSVSTIKPERGDELE